MTDAKDYRNAAQDPEFLVRNAREQLQANPEAIARYHASFERQRDQDQINRAIEAYEEARMGYRPKPKFILHIDGDHFHASRRRLPAGLIDLLAVALGGSLWFMVLFGLWLVFA